MENFNKNWLAILLIVIVFTAIGFILGWILKPPMPAPGSCKTNFPGHCGDFNMSMDEMDCDSLENMNVKVIVEKETDIRESAGDSNKTVIIKKVIR